MPARDPSAAPMAHLSSSTSHRHPQGKHLQHHLHHLESGLQGRRGSFPSGAERPSLPPSSVKSADGVTQLPTAAESQHDPETGRSQSISGIPTLDGAHDPGRRKSLWQSISGMTHGGSDDEHLDAGVSGVLSNGSAGGSGWFSVRGDSHSVYSDDA